METDEEWAERMKRKKDGSPSDPNRPKERHPNSLANLRPGASKGMKMSTQGEGAVRVGEEPIPVETEVGLSPIGEGKEMYDGQHHRVFEQPWQRQAAILRAAGFTPDQLADHFDRHVSTIYALDKTPWFQRNVNKLIEEKVGAGDILALAKARAVDAMNVMVEIMFDANAGRKTNLAAAIAITERAYGKPVAKVEQALTVTSADPVAELARLEQENHDLRQRVGDVAG